MRCKIDMDGYRKTDTGKPKVWQTDNKPTHCCEFALSLFVWEKNTKHNDYNGYSGYFPIDKVIIL